MLTIAILSVLIVLLFVVAKFTVVNEATLVKRQTITNVAFKKANTLERWVIAVAAIVWAMVSISVQGVEIAAVTQFLVGLWIAGAVNTLFAVLIGFSRGRFYSISFLGFAWRAVGIALLTNLDGNVATYVGSAFYALYLVWSAYVAAQPSKPKASVEPAKGKKK